MNPIQCNNCGRVIKWIGLLILQCNPVMLPQQPPYAPTQMPYLSDQLLRRFFIPHALPPFDKKCCKSCLLLELLQHPLFLYF